MKLWGVNDFTPMFVILVRISDVYAGKSFFMQERLRPCETYFGEGIFIQSSFDFGSRGLDENKGSNMVFGAQGSKMFSSLS